jgi:hypothetical protein
MAVYEQLINHSRGWPARCAATDRTILRLQIHSNSTSFIFMAPLVVSDEEGLLRRSSSTTNHHTAVPASDEGWTSLIPHRTHPSPTSTAHPLRWNDGFELSMFSLFRCVGAGGEARETPRAALHLPL